MEKPVHLPGRVPWESTPFVHWLHNTLGLASPRQFFGGPWGRATKQDELPGPRFEPEDRNCRSERSRGSRSTRGLTGFWRFDNDRQSFPVRITRIPARGGIGNLGLWNP